MISSHKSVRTYTGLYFLVFLKSIYSGGVPSVPQVRPTSDQHNDSAYFVAKPSFFTDPTKLSFLQPCTKITSCLLTPPPTSSKVYRTTSTCFLCSNTSLISQPHT